MPSSERTKILLLIPHLGGGGAEHVAETLSRFLDRRKYETHLGVVTTSHGDVQGYSSIENLHKLNTSRIRRSSLKLLCLIWRLRPAVILSGMAHLNVLVLLMRPVLPGKTLVFIRQNGHLSSILPTGVHARLSRFVYGLAYRRADIVVCQSESMKQEIQCELHVDQSKLVVLANPLDSDLIRRTVAGINRKQNQSAPRLIAVGRLVPEKGFDLLLDAFAHLSSRFSETELIIVGSGPCGASLKQQAQKIGIANKMRFSGHVPNPAVFFRDGSIFVLSSRTEGIPNAMLEAAAAGLPIVATPASTGVAHLLAKKEGVWMAHEISAAALRDALESAMTAIVPGQRYPHSWIKPFEIARSIPAYEAIIDRALEERAL